LELNFTLKRDLPWANSPDHEVAWDEFKLLELPRRQPCPAAKAPTLRQADEQIVIAAMISRLRLTRNPVRLVSWKFKGIELVQSFSPAGFLARIDGQ